MKQRLVPVANHRSRWLPYILFAYVMGVSGVCTLYSQKDLSRVELLGAVGYAILWGWSLFQGIRLPRAVLWMAAAAAAQALGFLVTSQPIDLVQPLHCALKLLAITGVLCPVIHSEKQFRWLLFILLAGLAANFVLSQSRHEIELLSESREKINMVAAYGMVYAVVGQWIGGVAGAVVFSIGLAIDLMTGCRSVLLGIVLGGFTLVFLARTRPKLLPRNNKRFWLVVAVLGIAAVALSYRRVDEDAKESFGSRLSHFLQEDPARAEPWAAGLSRFRQSPLLGNGLFTGDAGNAHNTWLCAAVAGGVPALLLLIAAQLSTFRALRRGLGGSRGSLAALSLAWWAALMGRDFFEGSLGGFGTSGMNWVMVAHLFLLGVGLRDVPLGRQRLSKLQRLRQKRTQAKPGRVTPEHARPHPSSA
ncbi:MAG TPA: O-antigen ligase family protein [Candidatus Acidoferrum sp.]|nr:O-antigen ligase family protein [Candidatus Acidoferrum sp.]